MAGRIVGLEVLAARSGVARVPPEAVLYLRDRNAGLLPIEAFGDGMRRILLMALAVTRARGGMLLIDESETAIHISALGRVFRWIVESCASNDVQLVATTHSLEAIDAILAADTTPEDDIVGYRLVPRRRGSDRLPGALLALADTAISFPHAGANAQRSAVGWVTARDRLHGRVVDRRPVVEMAPPSMLDSVVNGRATDPDPRRQRACSRSLESPATGQILCDEVLEATDTRVIAHRYGEYRDDLLARHPVPTFLAGANCSVAIHGVNGMTELVRRTEEMFNRAALCGRCSPCCIRARLVRPEGRLGKPCCRVLLEMPGRYCWSCGRRRPNKRFSRRSGRRGVCRDCHRLGPAELAYRQAVTDIDRALRYGEFIPRRQRKMIEQYLGHADERVRAYAAGVIARDAEARRESARQRREDELAYDAVAAFDEDIPCFDEDTPCFDEVIPYFDEDIPYFDEDIPYFDEDIPYFDEDIPYFDEDIPCFDEDIPCFDEDIPYFDEVIPYFDEVIPSEMPRVSPASPYLEATDDVAPLSQEEEQMLRQALALLRAGKGRTIDRVRQLIDAALRR